MKSIFITEDEDYFESELLRDLLSQRYYVTCIDNLMFFPSVVVKKNV